MDYNEVAVFIKVVQTGSFSAAAKKLGIPNSTASYKVSSLEKRLGVTLIQRTTRKLNITPAGQEYFKKCTLAFEAIEAAEAEVAAVQGEPQGLLRVTAPKEFGGALIAELIAEYKKKYPKVRVEFILTERRVDLLSESVDLAIRAGDLQDSSLIAKKIGGDYFIVVASPKYLKAHGTPTHPRELRHHSCVQFTPVGVDEWRMTNSKGSLNVPVSGSVLVNDLITVKNLAVAHEGIAYIPMHFCADELNSGKLVRILPDWRSTTAALHFVYPAQKFVSPKLKSFMEIASTKLKKEFGNES